MFKYGPAILSNEYSNARCVWRSYAREECVHFSYSRSIRRLSSQETGPRQGDQNEGGPDESSGHGVSFDGAEGYHGVGFVILVLRDVRRFDKKPAGLTLSEGRANWAAQVGQGSSGSFSPLDVYPSVAL